MHGAAGALCQRAASAPAAPRGIAFEIVAVHAAEQVIDRHIQRFALEIPQRQVERTQGMDFLPARRVEPRAIHILPAAFDRERVLADQPAGTLLQRVAGAPFADADQIGLGSVSMVTTMLL